MFGEIGMEWNMSLWLTASVLAGRTVKATGPRPGGSRQGTET